MESVNGEGQDRAAREVGRRTYKNHYWTLLAPGRSVCERCKIVRTYVKRGNKWHLYYQKPNKQKRAYQRRKVPRCGAPASAAAAP